MLPTHHIPSYLSAFSALEQNVDPDLRSLTESYWMDFRAPVNELGHLQQVTVRQLEGRWFIRSSYQELLREAADLAQRARDMAQSIRDDVAEASLNTPEFDALANHALALSKRFFEQPECLFRLSVPITPVSTEIDQAI